MDDKSKRETWARVSEMLGNWSGQRAAGATVEERPEDGLEKGPDEDEVSERPEVGRDGGPEGQ
jgi:hypothetical protein